MNKLLTLIGLVLFYTAVFPPLLVAAFVLFISTFTGGEYLLGNVFFEFVGGCACGFFGVTAFTKLNHINKQLRANRRQ